MLWWFGQRPPRNKVTIQEVAVNRRRRKTRKRDNEDASSEALPILAAEPVEDQEEVADPEVEARAPGNFTNRSATRRRRSTFLRLPAAINVRFLAISVIVLMAGLLGFRIVHHIQIHRLSGKLLDQAAAAEEAEDWPLAADLLHQYQQSHPQDVDILPRLAQAMDKSANSGAAVLRATAAYAKALDVFPGRDDLRGRMAELQLMVSPETAIRTADDMLRRTPEQPVALKVRAEALDSMRGSAAGAGQVRLSDVTNAYVKALAQNPSDMAMALRLAVLFRQNSNELASLEGATPAAIRERADGLIDDMVRRHPESSTAYLARFSYRRHFEATPGPSQLAPDLEALNNDVQQALKLDPDNADALIASAEILIDASVGDPVSGLAGGKNIDRGHLEEAERLFVAARKAKVADPRPYAGLSHIYFLVGDNAKNLEILEEGLEKVGAKDPLLNVRLADALLRMEKWDKARQTLDLLDEILPDEQSVAGKPRKPDAIRTARNLVRASWLLANGNPSRNPSKAVGLLNQVVDALPPDVRSAGVHMRLGQCYETMAQWDLAANEYEKAASADPKNGAAAFAAGRCLRLSGRAEASIARVRALKAAQTPGVDASLITQELALAEFDRQARAPREQRDWAPFRAAVAELRAEKPDSPSAVFLDACVMLAADSQDSKAKALALIKASAARYEKDRDFWPMAFEFYMNQKAFADAESALSHWETISGQPALAMRTRLRLSQGAPGLVAADVAATPERDPGAASPRLSEERLAELAQRFDAALRAGRADVATQTLAEVADAQPDNVLPREILVELAFLTGDSTELSKRQAELATLEGEGGTLWRYAKTLGLLMGSGDSTALEQASNLVREILARRPSWPRARAIEGMVAQTQGRWANAEEAFRKARELGDDRPMTIRAILLLMARRGDQASIREFLAQLSDQTLFTPEVVSVATRLALKDGDLPRATELVKRGLAVSPDQPELHVLAGQLILANNGPGAIEQAAEEIHQSARLAPADIRYWLAVLDFHAAYPHPDRAFRMLESVRNIVDIQRATASAMTPAQRNRVLARLLELRNDLTGSEEFARRARLASASGADGGSLVKGQSAASGGSLKRSSNDGAPTEVNRILKTIELSYPRSWWYVTAAESLDNDPRLEAVAWICRGGPSHRKKAIECLGRVKPGEDLRGDHLLKARLFLMDGATTIALDEWKAVSKAKPTMAQIVERFNVAIRVKSLDDARDALKQAEASDAKSPLVLPMTIQLLAAEGKADEAIKRAEAHLSTATDEADALKRAGDAAGWLRAIDRPDAAIALLRRATMGKPGGALAMADWLANQQIGIAEAAELCVAQSKADDSPRPALAAARVLLAGNPSAEQTRQLQEIVNQGAARFPDLWPLRINRAALLEFQDQPEQGLAEFQKALAERPNDAGLLNNIAWLLSNYLGKHEQALVTIDKAIRLVGPNPDLRDTKAVIMLNKGSTDDAVALLEANLGGLEAAATTYLHLAEACQKAGFAEEASWAKQAFDRFEVGKLCPRDEKAYPRLASR